MKPVIYDLEIKKAIPGGKDKEPRQGIEYCEGWEDHANMGIACLCAYDYHTGRYRVFTDKNQGEWMKLVANRDIVVGFNSMRFDQKVLEACWGPDFWVESARQYDILREIWRAVGLDVDKFVFKTHGGYSLDAVADMNLGMKKTGHGALAPIQWQEGNIGAVIDYCLEDVRITRLLFNDIIRNGKLISPKGGGLIDMPAPRMQRGRVPS